MQNRHFPAGHWVWIERENHADAYLGPYGTEAAADLAMSEAPLIEALCAEDCVDARVITAIPQSATEVHIIDTANPDHTGERHRRIWSSEHKAYVCATCTVDPGDVDAATASEHRDAGLPAAWEDCTAQ